MQAPKQWPMRLWQWVDQRYRLDELIQASLHVEIPRTAKTYYLGGVTLFFFIVQVTTGILLALYYQPTPDAAYDSVLFIMNGVRFGWLIRSIHAWSANLMVLFCVLHLLRIFFQGAYKPPRELTWIMGIFLLLVTMGFGFTGYLLPWDQRAFWATTVGSEIAGAIPVIGKQALLFLRGGADVTASTLSRFFGVHVLVLPVTLAAMLVAHITFVHQQGLADPKRLRATDSEDAETQSEETSGATSKRLLPFFPNYVLDEIIAWYAMLAILIILASVFPAGLEAPADRLRTPPHAKPEWYFLFLYQGLKLVPRIVGVALPFIGGLLLLLLPFWDRNPYVQARKRPVAIIMGILCVIGIVAFTIWGWLS
ncbi:MAG: cytochrome bc complex cytochrome b subunit [Chloroflexi bacterium]|nr:cytochrome bc complex cytochrome b subunit [Chloroflexota bacterium]